MKQKRTLMEMTDDMQALDDLLAEVGGDITDPSVEATVQQWFSELDSGMQSKVDNYCALISEFAARAKVRADEAERLASRAKRDEAQANWLKAMMLQALSTRGLRKFETERFTVSVVKNGGQQPIDLHSEVPPDWSLTRTEVVPDRARIRAALEAGESLSFATLCERGQRLAIK